MKYLEDRPNEAICQILMRAAREGIEWIEKGKYKRAELVLECALEDVSDIVEGRGFKKDVC